VITTVTVLSYEAMLQRARDHRIPANTFVVSIIDPEEEPEALGSYRRLRE